MSVVEAGFGLVRLPLRDQLHHSGTHTAELEEVLLRVRLDNGHLGWAETRGNGAYATGHTAASIRAALTSTPALPWHDPRAVASTLAQHCPPAAMLVDIATRCAQANAENRPLWNTFAETTPAHVPTHAAIAFGSIEQTAKRAMAAAGFSRVKIRIGGDPELDQRRIERVRDILGTEVVLAVDANGGWDIDTARAATRWLAELGVAWFEQPCADLAGLASVRAESPIPIWADESVRDANSVRAVAAGHAADGVHLKLEKAGTVDALSEAIDTARALGLQLGLGQMDCGRIGCASTTHLAAGLDIEIAELWGCANVMHDLATGFELNAGAVPVPQDPGLGIHISADPTSLIPLRSAK